MKRAEPGCRLGKLQHGNTGSPRSIVRLALAAAIAGCISPVMAQTANTKTTYTYDALDRLTQVTDPSGLNTTYQYDGLSDPTSLTSPDTGLTAKTYDAAGNVLTATDANGNTVTYTYDASDRRLSASYADSTQNITYTYDEANSVTGCMTSYPIGHLTRVVENAVTTVFCYNAQGYVTQVSQSVSGHTDVTSYTRSPGGKILSITHPSGNQVTYTYDANGRVSGVTATTGSGTTTVVSNVTYLPFGPVSGYTLGNGQAVTRTYDANYRLTDLTSPAFALHVARDAMGNITAVGNSAGASPVTETYSYDPLYRLTAITEADGSTLESITYNQTGDRLSKTGSGLATGAYSYNPNTHQLVATGNAARSVDANGNTTAISQAGSTYGFGYNARNRMAVAQLNQGTIASYSYNANAERVAKTANGTTERYNYGPGSQLLSEYGATNREYVYLDDIPVANLDTQGAATSVAYVTADQLGTPRAIADGSGNTVWSWAYQGNAWGEQAPTSSGYTYNMRFPGQYFDAETGLNYNVNRDYDSSTGRYVESDPMGLRAGASTYGYVRSNALRRVDALGLADLYYWRGYNGDWGHASIQLNDGTYISWWPVPGGHDLLMSSLTDHYWESDAIADESFTDDVNNEGHYPNEKIHLDGLDEDAIRKWWDAYKKSHRFNSAFQNCSTTVFDALSAGGSQDVLPGYPYPTTGIWSPENIRDYGQALQSALNGNPPLWSMQH
jgi:RHS repeat-associated protein